MFGDRPRTPEPPQSPRDIANKPVYCPTPPSLGAGRDDKGMAYSPVSNPLGHGQALLRSTVSDTIVDIQAGQLLNILSFQCGCITEIGN